MFQANSSCGPSPLDFTLEATPRALVLPVSLLAGYVLESFVFKTLSVNTKRKTLAGVSNSSDLKGVFEKHRIREGLKV